jgi:hypothetical protein
MTILGQSLTYHQATFALLDMQPRVAPEALEQLAQVEERLSQPLPAAVREWYSLQDAVALLARYSNDDHPLEIPKLGTYDLSRYRYSRDRLLAEGILVFLIENQSVCYWAIWLDGSDDPPVIVSTGGSLEIQWDIHAERFSTFVYTRVWDFATWFAECCLLVAIDQPLDLGDLAMLRSRFWEGPQTYEWPATITHRFSRDNNNQRILIWSDESRQADWALWASSEQGLLDLAQDVWRCGTLAEKLEPWITVSYEAGHEVYGPDECSKRVLAALRCRRDDTEQPPTSSFGSLS